MHVLYLAPRWPPESAANGIVSYVSRLVPELHRQGHIADIVAKAADGRLTYFASTGFGGLEATVAIDKSGFGNRVDRVLGRLDRSRSSTKGLAKRFNRLLQSAASTADLELLQIPDSFGTARHIMDRVRAPVCVRLHGPWFQNGAVDGRAVDQAFLRRVRHEGEAIRRAHCITAPSEIVLRATCDYYNLRLTNSAVIPNPITPALEHERWHAENAAENMILFIGRFDRHKGGDIIIRAFASLAKKFRSLRLVFIGPDRGCLIDGSARISLQDFVDGLLDSAVRSRLSILGQMAPTTLDNWRRQAAITVVASRYETFGNVALEACRLGCPVVATRAGAISDIVHDGKTGVLVDPDDPAALADAIEQVLKNPSAAAGLGAAAHKDVAERFAPSRIANATIDFYREAIDSGRQTR